MVKAVLFDLDGTLVNSLEDLADASNRALSAMGFPQHETEKFKYFVGDGIPKLIERIIPPDYRTEDCLSKCLKLFFDYYSVHFSDKTTIYRGVPEVIADLRKNGILTAVVSNKAQEMTNLVVGKFYKNSFDLVIGKQEGMPGKPHPDMLLKAAADLSVKASECAFVGDSGMDIKAAVNAHMKPVGVLWGFRKSDELKENGASYLADSPEKLLGILKSI